MEDAEHGVPDPPSPAPLLAPVLAPVLMMVFWMLLGAAAGIKIMQSIWRFLGVEAVAKLKELRSCTDELPAGYCQHGMLQVPFGVSYGAAVQKILSKND